MAISLKHKLLNIYKNVSLRSIIVGSFLFSGLIPIIIITLISYNASKTEIKNQLIKQLESVRNLKKIQIYDFFSERIKDISVITENPYTHKAFKDLEHSFFKTNMIDRKFIKNDKISIKPSNYQESYDKYFPYFNFLIKKYGYYDLFFLSKDNGTTFFTLKKESDFGIKISKYNSPLRDVWKKVKDTHNVSLSDTKPYSPSNNAPAQFLAAPIIENNILIGIIAIQITINSIDTIMKDRSGLWKTAETYLIGSDNKLRSNSLNEGNKYSLESSSGNGILRNKINTLATEAVFRGETSHLIIQNYSNKKVISAFTPLNINNLRWSVFAEVEFNEIDEIVSKSIKYKIIFLFLISLLILLIISIFISYLIDKEIIIITSQTKKLISDVLSGNLKNRGKIETMRIDFRVIINSTNELIEAFVSQWEKKHILEEKILISQKLEAIGTLSGGIAHDFNNLLTSLFSLSYIVISELPKSSPAALHMGELNDVLHKASNLVNQILTFGRQTNDDNMNVEVNSIVSNNIKILGSTIPKNIKLSSILPEENIFINLSPSHLNQIIMNLATNSLYSIDKNNGLISISVGSVYESIINKPSTKSINYCKLSISDNGTGIPKSIQSKIYDPFFTTKPSGKGSGLGLSIIYNIVNNADGYIECDSILGKGTTFNLFFPVIQPVSETESILDIPQISGSGEKILFIDDEKQICTYLSKILERAGFEVFAFTDPLETESIFKNNPEMFDIIITDYNMPGINGIELIKKFLKIRDDIPIILTSGLTNIINDELFKQIGLSAFIKKPIQPEQLIQVVSNCLIKK